MGERCPKHNTPLTPSVGCHRCFEESVRTFGIEYSSAAQNALARIAALEAENERLRGEDAGADINIRELWARVQSAESALAAAREECERLRKNTPHEFAVWWNNNRRGDTRAISYDDLSSFRASIDGKE